MTSVHLIVSRREAECIEDALKLFTSNAQAKTKNEILRQLESLLRGSKPKSNGWAPIRSSWPSGAVPKRTKNSNSYFKKPREATAKSAKPAKKPLTAQEILNSL